MTMTVEPGQETVMPPKLYWGPAEIGALFGVPGHTVVTWRQRYTADRVAEQLTRLLGRDPTPEEIAAAAFPEPDITLGTIRPNDGWDPAREDEIRTWERSRPGPGAGGGRRKASN